mgnify:CR=1 FL=1|tara:strand:+ start:409 stop:810 length:402 start_codon:yes stop_codon:yes gene_type:complete
MATSASIGDLFLITLENTTSEQTTKTITPGRALTIESVEIVMLAGTGGTSTFSIASTGGNLFGGTIASKINNVNLVVQASPPTGGGSGITLVPSANNVLSATDTLSITVAGANASYIARFYCSAASPAALTVS